MDGDGYGGYWYPSGLILDVKEPSAPILEHDGSSST